MVSRFFNRLGLGPGEASPPDDIGPPVSFTPLNELEMRLVAAVAEPGGRPSFNAALLDATIFAATSDLPTMRGTIEVPAGGLRLRTVPAPDGGPVAALFTARERLAERFGGSAPFVAMRGEQLIGMIAAHGAMLNQGLPISAHWSADDLATLLGRPVRQEDMKNERLLLGMPARTPHALVDGLREVLGADRRIEAAWLALARWPDRGDDASWFLDVRARIDRDELRRLLAPLFREVDFAGRPLQMVLCDPDAEQGTGIQLL